MNQAPQKHSSASGSRGASTKKQDKLPHKKKRTENVDNNQSSMSRVVEWNPHAPSYTPSFKGLASRDVLSVLASLPQPPKATQFQQSFHQLLADIDRQLSQFDVMFMATLEIQSITHKAKGGHIEVYPLFLQNCTTLFRGVEQAIKICNQAYSDLYTAFLNRTVDKAEFFRLSQTLSSRFQQCNSRYSDGYSVTEIVNGTSGPQQRTKTCTYYSIGEITQYNNSHPHPVVRQRYKAAYQVYRLELENFRRFSSYLRFANVVDGGQELPLHQVLKVGPKKGFDLVFLELCLKLGFNPDQPDNNGLTARTMIGSLPIDLKLACERLFDSYYPQTTNHAHKSTLSC